MKETKFRAWATEANEMYYDVWFNLIEVLWWSKEDEDDVILGDRAKNNLLQHCILMQFTGLKDKNGKEIYEGDIVCGMRGVIGVCEFYHGRFAIKYFEGIRLTFIYENKDDVEIIGNIYENPELLEAQ